MSFSSESTGYLTIDATYTRSREDMSNVTGVSNRLSMEFPMPENDNLSNLSNVGTNRNVEIRNVVCSSIKDEYVNRNVDSINIPVQSIPFRPEVTRPLPRGENFTERNRHMQENLFGNRNQNNGGRMDHDFAPDMNVGFSKFIELSKNKHLEALVNSLEIIDGNDGVKVFLWLCELNKIVNMGSFPLMAILYAACTRVTGRLVIELQKLITMNYRWFEVRNWIMGNFVSPMARHCILSEFVYRIQGRSECLLEYVESIETASEIMDVAGGECSLIYVILNGMNPEARKNCFGNEIPRTMQQMKNKIYDYILYKRSVEDYNAFSSKQMKAKGVSHAVQGKNFFSDNNEVSESAISDKVRFDRQPGSQPFNTGIQKCFGCGEVGHYRRNCLHFQKNKKVIIRENDGKISFASGSKKAVFVKGVVDRELVSAVIDTASTANLISSQFIVRHSKQSEVRRMSTGYNAVLATGVEFVSHELILLDVKIAGLVFRVEFVVVEKLPSELILGISFLKETKSMVDFVNDKLILGRDRRKVALQWTGSEFDCGVRSTENVSVAAKSGFASLFILTEIKESSSVGSSELGEGCNRNSVNYASVGSQTEHSEECEGLDSEEWSDAMTEEVRRRFERLCQIQEEVQDPSSEEDVTEGEINEFVTNFKKEFRDVITDRVGCLKNFTYKIQLRDPTPVKFNPYPLPRHKELELKKVIDQLIKDDVLEEIDSSDYASPCFIVKNRSGKPRLVANFSELNKRLILNQNVTPNMEDCLARLTGCRYYSRLDFNQAFHQLRLDPESQRFVAITTPFGMYSYKKIAQGLQCGPGVLNKVMRKMFFEYEDMGLNTFFDDILLGNVTWEEHKQLLYKVFYKLRESGLTVSPSKSLFVQKKIRYLGMIVDGKNISMDPERIKIIHDLPEPRNRRGLLKILGMINFFSKYIEDYATIIEPLNKLRSPKVEFVWGEEQRFALAAIKRAFEEQVILKAPDLSQKFIVHCDASSRGLAGVLSQYDGTSLRPVAFYSKGLRECDKRRSMYELEFLSLVQTIMRYRHYLFKPFKVYTDSKSLMWFLRNPKRVQKYGALVEILSEFSFEVEHLSSKENLVSDVLTRVYDPYEFDLYTSDIGAVALEKNIAMTNFWQIPFLAEPIEKHQRADQRCAEILEKLEKGEEVDGYKIQKGRLIIKTRSKNNPYKIYIPEGLRKTLLDFYHKEHSVGAHQGIKRTMRNILRKFSWETAIKDIAEYVRSCDECQKAKARNTLPMGKLMSSFENRPLANLHVDVVGPITSSAGRRHILVCVDNFSRFTIFEGLKVLNAKNICDVLYRIFMTYGMVESISCDNATYFRSEYFGNFCFGLGIRRIFLSPYAPSSNLCERMSRQLGEACKCYFSEQQNRWYYRLKEIQYALNNCHHSGLGMTPNELFLGRRTNNIVEIKWEICDESIMDENRIRERWKVALTNLEKSWKKMKERYDKRRSPVWVKVGEMVLIKDVQKSSLMKKISRKLCNRWNGPFEIKRFLTPNTVLLEEVSDRSNVRRSHVGNIKKYYMPRNA